MEITFKIYSVFSLFTLHSFFYGKITNLHYHRKYDKFLSVSQSRFQLKNTVMDKIEGKQIVFQCYFTNQKFSFTHSVCGVLEEVAKLKLEDVFEFKHDYCHRLEKGTKKAMTTT